MKGYKVFNSDWKCRDFQYKVGEEYKTEGELKVCRNGFHFCERLIDCFNYYSFNLKNKVAIIETLGEVKKDGDKSVTNHIKIVSELTWQDVLNLVNTGKENSGNRNSGDRNSGDFNSGDRNSGDSNSGYSNSGDWNSGNRNSGNRNSGDRNSGYWNSGFGNSCNYSSGVFNTQDEKIKIFDVQSDMTLTEFYQSDFYKALFDGDFDLTEWIHEKDMSDEEKHIHKKYETQGGYLKTIPYKTAWQENWKNKSDKNKKIVISMPNFDADKFFEITGIDARGVK